MRLSILGPGHVLLQSPRGARWLAFACAIACTGGAAQSLSVLGSQPPVLVAAVFAALLLLGTTAALLRATELELQPGTVRWRRRGVFADTEVTTPRTALRHVRMRGQLVTQGHGSSKQRSMRYLVELIAEHAELPPVLELARHHREVAVRRLAEELARAANLPVLDAIGDHPELRTPDALDAPPRARSPLPTATPPAGIALRQARDGQGMEASTTGVLRRRQRALLPAVAVASLAFSIAAGASLASAGKGMPALVWIVFGLAELMLLCMLFAMSRRRQRVFVHDGELHVVQDLLGMPLRHRRLPTAAIERVRLQSSTPEAPQLQSGLAVVSDDEVVVVGNSLEAEELRWLQAWVEAQVWPALPVQATDATTTPTPPTGDLGGFDVTGRRFRHTDP